MARSIIQKYCHEIVHEDRPPTELPKEITAIISKKFIFAVSLTDESFSTGGPRKYKIDAILGRSDRRNSSLNNNNMLAGPSTLITPSKPSTEVPPEQQP